MKYARTADAGFTMVELIVVVGIIGIIVAMAIPEFGRLRESYRYREEARGIAATLRDARARAVAQNREHQIFFDLLNAEGVPRYQLQRNVGTPAAQIWQAVYGDWITFGPDINIARGDDCDVFTDITLQFNPNGSANQGYICIMGNDGVWRYKCGVSTQTTGRIVVMHH